MERQVAHGAVSRVRSTGPRMRVLKVFIDLFPVDDGLTGRLQQINLGKPLLCPAIHTYASDMYPDHMTDIMTKLFLALASGTDRTLRVDELLKAADLPAEVMAAVSNLREEMSHALHQREATRTIIDAATLITAARNIDEALELVCRRSKILLNSDMAYISLNDLETQETYICATDGVVTSEYRHLRMPLGSGILGQAAGGSNVMQTSGYIGDGSFPHIPFVDDAVREEGVESILAVTMRVGGERLGALLVADRRRRVYVPQEIDLLTQIAGLAAVALQRAEQMDGLKALLAERDKAQTVVESENALLHRIEHLDHSMFAILRDEDSPAELARVIGEAIGTRVEALHLSDMEGHRPAEGTPIFEHACRRSQSGYATLATAMSGKRTLGALEAHDTLDRDQMLLFERAVAVLTSMTLAHERGWATDLQVQHRTVRDLENNTAADWKSVVGRMARYRLQEGTTVRVVGLRTDRVEDARNDLRELVNRRGGITSVRGDVLRVISSNLTGQELYDRLTSQGRRSAIAEMETLLTPDDVGPAISTVQRTVRAMEALNITGVADPRWDLGLTGLAIAGLPPATADLLVRRTLQPALDFDQRHGTELVLTAWEFLEADGRSIPAAQNLHIHPNTLRQRVHRIGQLLGEDWCFGGRRADVHLALRLWRIMSREP